MITPEVVPTLTDERERLLTAVELLRAHAGHDASCPARRVAVYVDRDGVRHESALPCGCGWADARARVDALLAEGPAA